MIALYLMLVRVGAPLFKVLFFLRCRSGKEDPARAKERFGVAGKARPGGALVWIHAASVGETASVLPLVDRLSEAGTSILLTTVTRTSAEIAAQKLPDGVVHQYMPYDSPRFWQGFLGHWRPDLALIVESEVWPACFDALSQSGCPFGLINARVSERSFRTWLKVPEAAGYVFSQLSFALAQSAEDAHRLKKLGCDRVVELGNLKFDAIPARPAPLVLDTLRKEIGERPVWLAALTHPGEDEIALSAHKDLLRQRPGLLLLLVPRHPVRADDVMELATAQGLTTARRSRAERVTDRTHVYLGDTLGEMNLFYSMADCCFLAGSFSHVGGHSPVEAISFQTALLSGPKVANARPVYQALWRTAGAVKVEQPALLSQEVARLLDDERLRQSQAVAASKVIEGGQGALNRTLDFLHDLLPDVKPDLSKSGRDEGGSRC